MKIWVSEIKSTCGTFIYVKQSIGIITYIFLKKREKGEAKEKQQRLISFINVHCIGIFIAKTNSDNFRF